MSRYTRCCCAMLLLWAAAGPALAQGGPPLRPEPPGSPPIDPGPIGFDPGQKSGAQGDTLASIAKLPAFSGNWLTSDVSFGRIRQTSDSPDPNNPNVPKLQPQWAQYRMLNKVQNKGTDGTGAKNNAALCIPDGMPGVMSIPIGYEFLFTPGRVTIISQNGEVRRIWTDGRRHPADPDLKFEGHSIGYWRDGKLYVDTTAILGRSELFVGMPGSANSHVVERMFLRKPKELEIDTVVTNPDVLVAPFRYIRTYDYAKDMEEAICQENNRDNNGSVDLTPPP